MDETLAQNHSYLPLGYDDNKIVLLPKDPYWLYAYWELSEAKRHQFCEQFGKDLWTKSFPVLKITNVSRNTSFFVQINDFSNSWYINVPEADSLYIAEIGRKVSDSFFINMANSNYVATPPNSASTNTAAYFVNYEKLQDGKLDMECASIHASWGIKSHLQYNIGISSGELYFREACTGLSSADIFSAYAYEHIAGDSFFNKD